MKTSHQVSKEDAIFFADQLESALGEVANGKRKPHRLTIEPMIGLIQFARDSAKPTKPDASVAAIEFALKTDDGMTFLRLWSHGEFDVIREEWPDAPIEVFIGADPLMLAVTD